MLHAPHRFLGWAQLAAWGAFAVVSWRFRLEFDPVSRPFGVFFGLLGVAFAFWLAALFRFWNAGADKLSWRTILFWALAMRLPLIFASHPVQEIDYYRYLWDGRCVLEGMSPYRYSPADLDRMRTAADWPDEASGLIHVLDRHQGWEAIFSRIDHREVPTIYPPVSQVVFAVAVAVLPDSVGPYPRIVALRSVLAVFDLAVVALLLRWLVRRGLPPARATLYAWCPLVLKEFANGAHMDAIPVFFTVAAWFCLSGQAGRRESDSRYAWLGWLAWVAAVLAKWYPLIMAPVLFSRDWSRRRWAALPPVTFSVGVIVAIQIVPLASSSSSRSRDAEGMRTFLGRWEMNDLIFSVIRENLRTVPIDSGGEPWYSVAPASIRRAWSDAVSSSCGRMGMESPPDIGFVSAQGFALAVTLGVGLWLARRRWEPETEPFREGHELGRRLFAVLAVAWYVGATQNPWYWTWSLPFATFATSRLWWFVPVFASAYYLRFWLVYSYPLKTESGWNGARFFDEVVVWFEHGPILALWLGLLVFRRTRWTGNKTEPSPLSSYELKPPP